jgi:hypothetical protein
LSKKTPRELLPGVFLFSIRSNSGLPFRFDSISYIRKLNHHKHYIHRKLVRRDKPVM